MHNNCVESIKAALKEYDGCEFDVRPTKDEVMMLYHNSTYKGRRVLESRRKTLKGLDTFQDLLEDQEIIRLVNDEKKTLWIETKEDSGWFFKSDQGYCKKVARLVTKQLKSSDLDLDRVQVISFCPDILTKIQGIKRMRIFPFLFSTARHKFPSRNHRTIYNMFTPITSHIKWSKKKGFNGILFSKLYINGFFSRFQPEYKDILKHHTEDFKLVTGPDTLEEEEFFNDIMGITDYRGKRKKKRKAPLICHRGLGPNPKF